MTKRLSINEKALDRSKYLKLGIWLFITPLVLLVLLVGLFLLTRWVFGLLDHVPFLDYVYAIVMLTAPAAIFIPAHTIFLLRSRTRTKGLMKIISLVLLGAFILAWMVVLVADMITFFRTFTINIGKYYAYEKLFLFSNIFVIFFLGIAQALGAPPEKHWLERGQSDNF